MLTSLALILLLGMLLGSIFKKLRLPSLVGMLLAGVLLGPHALALVSDDLMEVSPELRRFKCVINQIKMVFAMVSLLHSHSNNKITL